MKTGHNSLKQKISKIKERKGETKKKETIEPKRDKLQLPGPLKGKAIEIDDLDLLLIY